jgi:hypothetical protein
VVAASSSIVDSAGTSNVPPDPSGASLVVGVALVEVEPEDDVAVRSSFVHAASAVRNADVPAALRRKARRLIPSLRELASAVSNVRRTASATTGERGRGAYSPFDSG